MIRRIIPYIYASSLLLLPTLAWGQDVSIQGKLDRTEIKTGEQAAVDLVIRTNDLPKTKFYLREDAKVGEPYTVIQFGAIDTVDVDGRLKEITAKLIITSFDSTLITIPPIVVETPSGKAETEPMALNVVQPEVDAAHPESFRDIKAPWEVKLSLRDWIELILRSWLFWAILAAAVLAYGGYRLYCYMSRRATVEPELPPVEQTIWELTTMRLATLEDKQLWRQGLYKEYYSELVEIIKAYLDVSRGWSTAEMTSSELLDFVDIQSFTRALRTSLASILQQADLSKFAKSSPSEDEARTALADTRCMLEQLEQERSVQPVSEPADSDKEAVS
ncbi:MAG: hypothetical protein SOW66_00065 [Porphyromonas sp.]|nr:hypothetical protein [Porphyromonas sp.]